jgi:hypothetical protein
MSSTKFYEKLGEKMKKIENQSVSEIETIAIGLSRKLTKGRSRGMLALRLILGERQHKLNKDFVFTPEHIEKFIWIDEEIKKCLNSLRKEGEEKVKELELIIKNEKSYFIDYEIEAVINPRILIWKEEFQSLCEPDEDDGIIDVIDGYHYDTFFRLKFDPRHLDHSLYFEEFNTIDNWNTMVGAKNNEFENYHIGYGMHELYEHSLWSLSDIMKINDFWCELKVEYQRY